jgi:class 3 adenylate cyclase
MPVSNSSLASRIVSRVELLRAQLGGKAKLLDAGLLAVISAGAAAAALLLGLSTPVRFVENLTYDLRASLGAPPNATPMVIVKLDDAAIAAMVARSPCRCLSPIDKVWLADVIAALSAKGVTAIGVDVLLDTWKDNAEFADFEKRTAGLSTPVIAVVDPDMKPGVDYPVDPKLHYADARALVSSDYDDVIRRYDPRPGPLPALSTAVAQSLGVKLRPGPFQIRYRKPDATLTAENLGAIAPSYSAAFIPLLPAELLRGRVALIGAVTRSARADSVSIKEDMHMTPLRFLPGHFGGTPGVEVHANALSQMMAGDHIVRPGWVGAAALAFLAALGGGLIGRATLSWWLSTAIIGAGILVYLLASFGLYAGLAVMIPVAAPAIAFALGFFLLSRLAAARLAGERAFYSSTLERYLSPQVIERIVDGAEPVKIGADEREITVLVSDLESFSTLVADTEIKRFSVVINAYFDGLIDILWKHEALVDKMTGDGVIALFGAPVLQPDHADRALACARDIAAYSRAYSAQMAAEGVKFGRTRVGLNSGVGLVGNFGGERRFNYTAYGQVVVIAARLEAANKEFDTTTLFSQDTYDLAKVVDDVRPVGETRLKGVSQPVPAYTFI